MNQKLKILILEKEIEKVSLTFPVFTVNLIDSLVPEYVKEKLIEKEIDIHSIVNQAKNTDYKPQDLFDLKIADKYYKIWIE